MTIQEESPSDRISNASRRPKNLGASLPGSISLAMGEPFADTAPPIRAAVTEALDKGRTRYTQLTGSPELREAIAASVSSEVGRSVTADHVVVSHGGSAGLAAATIALIKPGDRVIVPEPTYSLYIDHLAMVGAQPVWVRGTAAGRLDLPAIARHAPDARMIVLCSPNNPTGLVATPDEMLGLAEILSQHPHLLLLADEAYSAIVFDGRRFVSGLELDAVRERVVVVRTFSKAYAMTGWRLGYVIATPPIAASVNLVHRTVNGALNTFVQDAAVVALKTPSDHRDRMVRAYQVRRDRVVQELSGLPGVSLQVPEGAFYAFPRVDVGIPSDDLTERLAEGGVLVRSGTEFGPSGEGHVRISFATELSTLDAGLKRFANIIRAL